MSAEFTAELAQILKSIDERLEATSGRPDASLDWLAKKTWVDGLVDDCEGPLAEALIALEASDAERDLVEALRFRVATTFAEVGALAHLSGQATVWKRMVERAIALGDDPDWSLELDAALKAPDVYASLQDGRWLNRHEQYREAGKVLRAARAQTDDETLRHAIDVSLNAPRPIRSAPPLFKFNGFGTGFIGSRDEAPDGSHVTTLCITALFIPIFPIRAYRVWSEGQGGYQVQGWVPLSPLARIFQVVTILAVVGLGGAYAFNAHRSSPDYLAGQTIDEAGALEAAGDREGALQKYWEVIDEYDGQADVREAALGVVRLGLAGLPKPCTPAAVEPAHLAINGYSQLSPPLRDGAPANLLVDRLQACAAEISSNDLVGARAQLEIVQMANDVGQSRPELLTAKTAATRAVAEHLETSRPAEALGYWVDLMPDADARSTARGIIVTFGDAHALWVDNADLITRYLTHGGDGEISAGLERAREQRKTSLALVETGDEAKLRQALESNPSDHDIAMAVAKLELDEGRVDGAIATLKATGSEARMPTTVQLELAQMYRSAGQLAEADAILTPLVDQLQPSYQRAVRAFSDAVERIRSQAIADVDAGRIDPELNRRAENVAESERPRIFQEWLNEQIDKNPDVVKAREALQSHELVVPASIALGTVKLERGQASRGEQREKLLAEAESVFVAISSAAAGHPSYHLGLGQLYHRMGRPDEGDAQLDRVLAMESPLLTMAVGNVYRELGLLEKMRNMLTELHGTDIELPMKQQVALTLSIVAADLEEKERWLKLANQNDPAVVSSLAEARGAKAMRDGRWDDADQAFAQSAAFWESQGSEDGAAANNAAVANQGRYAATGDLTHQEKAVRALEQAVKLSPKSVVSNENLSNALTALGSLRVLSTWVGPEAALSSDDASSIIASMLGGDDREAVLRAIRANPELRRAQELRRQLIVLSPHRYDAYGGSMQYLGWLEDVDGLQRLYDQVKANPKMAVANLDQRHAYERGERDDVLRQAMTAERDRARLRLEKLGPNVKPSTRAALHFVLAQKLQGLAMMNDDAKGVAEATGEMRKAVELWPGGGLESDLSFSLALEALYAARLKSKRLDAAWKAQWRQQSLVSIIDETIGGEGGAEVLAALRAQPQLDEAVQVLEPSMARRPRVWHLPYARWSDRASAIEAALAHRASPLLALPIKIDAHIFGDEPREQAYLRQLERNQKD